MDAQLNGGTAVGRVISGSNPQVIAGLGCSEARTGNDLPGGAVIMSRRADEQRSRPPAERHGARPGSP